MSRGIFRLTAVACLAACWAFAGAAPPNILLIVADDLGYTDLGAYGGEIATPTIDALAGQGILFTRFYTSPYCSPTRAMLLSGNNNHVAGVANQQVVGVAGLPLAGYEASLSDRIAPFPRLLQAAGYDTYMVGKWHLGVTRATSPPAAGFSRSFGLLQGGGSHFSDTGFENEKLLFRDNGEPAPYPAGRYATEFYTDKLIEYIEADRGNGKPFFAFASYTAPHWPLQVPDEYLDLYSGRYDDGYDALRVRRFEAVKKAGIVPSDSTLPPRNDSITEWDELTAERKRIESRKMELYAAMVDNLDDHVGRLLRYLENNDLRENTLIILMSDNGAAGEDFYNGYPSAAYRAYIRARFDNSYDKMGTARSFVSYGPPWAEAASAPFRLHKSYMFEGGVLAPLIISGPAVSHRGAVSRAYTTVMDLAPTILEIAGAAYPDDGSVRPMLGESMASLLAGKKENVHGDSYVTVMSHRGRTLVRKGRWKIVTMRGPFDESKFELYDVVTDPAETTDLRSARPEIFAEMLNVWRIRRKELGIVLPEDL